jgi:hypothetical protein
MSQPPVPLVHSIPGRLYAVIGMMLVAMIATNVQTVVYSNTVTAGTRAVATVSIDGLRAVDEFDDLLDQHRRALTAATERQASLAVDAVTDHLSGIERQLLIRPGCSWLKRRSGRLDAGRGGVRISAILRACACGR